MLILSRKKNESIIIQDDITVTVIGIRGGTVRLGIAAPDTVPIMRRELRVPAEHEDIEEDVSPPPTTSRKRDDPVTRTPPADKLREPRRIPKSSRERPKRLPRQPTPALESALPEDQPQPATPPQALPPPPPSDVEKEHLPTSRSKQRHKE